MLPWDTHITPAAHISHMADVMRSRRHQIARLHSTRHARAANEGTDTDRARQHKYTGYGGGLLPLIREEEEEEEEEGEGAACTRGARARKGSTRRTLHH